MPVVCRDAVARVRSGLFITALTSGVAVIYDGGVHVRPAVAADAPEIVRLKRLLIESWPISVDFSVEPDWATRCERIVVELMDKPGFRCFVADAPKPGSTLAGCVTCALDQRIPGPGGSGLTAYVADMCVDEPWRGQGLGQLLLDAAMEWGESHQASWGHLYATPQAVHLYEKNGFEPDGRYFTHMSGSMRRRSAPASADS